jgi:hypothetical protein
MGQTLANFISHIREHNRRAFTNKPPRGRLANAAGGACHEDNSAFQCAHC